jgi:hypothetical protein
MYNVILDKATLQSGREIARTTLGNRATERSNGVPVGAVNLLQLFLDQAESSFDKYVKYADGSDRGFFNLANTAITSLTAAAEFVSEQQGNLRIVFLKQYEKERTPDHHRFYSETSRMLSLMGRYINFLTKKRHADVSPEQLAKAYHNRLMFAAHLADLAVNVTHPQGNSFYHPDSSKWLATRAKTGRNLASSLIAIAKLDEAEARKLDAQTERENLFA